MFQTLKSLSLIAGSNVFNSMFGFASTVLIARTLGAGALGALAIYVSVVTIFLQLAGQGIDWATVRLASKYLDEDHTDSLLYFKVMFKIRVVLGLIMLVAGYLLAGPIAYGIFGKPEYVPIIRFAAVAALGSSFCFYVLSYYQTTQQFLKFGVVNLIGNGSKLLLVLLFIATGLFSIDSMLAAYAIVGFFGAVLGFYWMPKGYLKVPGDERKALSSLLGIGKWMMAASLIDALYRRLDVLLLGYFVGTTKVGIYSAALNITFAAELLIISSFTVLMPKVSKLNTDKEFKEYIIHSLKLSLLIALPLLSLYWVMEPIIVFFYSDTFIEAGKIFRILFTGFLSSLIFQPISLLFFAKDRPDFFVYIQTLLVVMVFIGHIIWIPRSGIVGAAYVTLGGRIAQGILISIVTYFLVYRPRKFITADNTNTEL